MRSAVIALLVALMALYFLTRSTPGVKLFFTVGA